MFGRKVQVRSRTNVEGFSIGQMVVGQMAYSPLEAMRVDTRNNWWLNPQSPARGRPSATNQLQIKLEKDGYYVSVPPGCEYVMRQHADRTSFAGTEYVEVTKLLQS